jgi:repressor LexA
MKIKILKPNESDALRRIRNRFVHHGKAPTVRELMTALGYKSPRSAALIIDSLIRKGFLKKRPDGELQLIRHEEDIVDHARTIDVPLVGTVPCGSPLFAEENIEAFLPVSVSLARPGSRYFLLRAKGDSMNDAGINNGDFVLVRQQPMADNGNLVVALIDNEATIKEFRRTKDAVILRPRSSNPNHQPIILTSDFQIQGIVVKAIPNFE